MDGPSCPAPACLPPPQACGLCNPAALLAGGPAALLPELEALSAALLLAVKNLGCGASGACLTGVSGMAVTPGLLRGVAGPGPAAGGEAVAGGGAAGGRRDLPPGMRELPGA